MNTKQQKQQLLNDLYAPYIKCLKCPLGSLGRTNVVFGGGNPDAALMLIGEAPGQKEDQIGIPFIGRSGQLLDRALKEAGILREHVFITSTVKCRPPGNRNPTSAESNICKNLLLFKQIKIIEPKVICTLGSIAIQALLEKKIQVTEAKLSQFLFENSIIVPTYHPAYILRNPKKFELLVQDLIKACSLSKENQKY